MLPRFADNSLIRMRQHVLFYWDQSYLKSTLLDLFYECIPDTVEKLDVTTNSPEVLFGSITDDKTCPKIILPAFTGFSIAKINELATFVTGSKYQEIVNLMNKIMEGENVQRQLLKFGLAEISEEEILNAEAKGVFFNPLQAQLTFRKPEITIFAGSRPLDNRTYTYLKTSGHLYRYHILQHEITNEEAIKYLKENRKPDLALCEQLKTLNAKMAAAKVKRIEMPNELMTGEIMETLKDIVLDGLQERKTRLATIIDMRTKGDIIRETVAHAAIRTMVQAEYKDIEQIQYTEEDKEFIIDDIEHFIEAKINPLFAEEFSKPSTTTQRPIEQVQKLILEFLADGNERSRQEIDDYLLTKTKACKATVSNALKKLAKDDKISHRFGY